MELDETALIRRVIALTGVTDGEALRRIGHAVTSVLLEELPAHEGAWLGARLPPDWVDRGAQRVPVPTQDGLEDFYDRVAAREGAEPGFAREHAQSCCRALAEACDDDARRHLTSRLPNALAPLFDLSETGHTELGHPAHQPRTGRTTLSEGRPSSHRPISEVAPQRAQQDSVARSGNPHADTKLSSSAGTTQEREDETLSRGRGKA